MSHSPSTASRPLSLGVIFLTLYIDLIGFSIIFPLVPDLLSHYLQLEGQTGLLGWLLDGTGRFAQLLGKDGNYAAVLFGGVLSSLFAALQFIFAPLWGSLSDRRGRRSVLLITVAGTAFSYALWALSGSFLLFVISRLVGGAFGGNLSVATAAVADVTTREERSRAMGVVGAAFGLGLVTGPMIGALTAHFNLLDANPSLAQFGLNPFSIPALIALAMSLINLVWIQRRFHETLPEAARNAALENRTRNPVRAILSLDNRPVQQINVLSFFYALAFCAMEFSLTFLGQERFGYSAMQNGMMIGFLGLCSIVTQGFIVRKLLKKADEIRVLTGGLLVSVAGLLAIGFAYSPWLLYTGLALLALGSGLVNPSSSGLISLYSSASEQGRVLGIFRSLGSLARAITPVLAGFVFWTFGATSVFAAGAALAIIAFWLGRKLPKPVK